MKIGILYVGISEYVTFWSGFYFSAEKYLFPEIEKHYFLFTDRAVDVKENVTRIYQEDLGWPKNVLYRYKMFVEQKEVLKAFDYLFFFNGNTCFKRAVTIEELLPTASENYLTCLYWHIFYAGKNPSDLPYERNKASMAYIPFDKGHYYFQAGLVGGRQKEYIELLEWAKEAVEIDEKNGIVGVDEPYLNRYLLDHSPIKVLDTHYGKPEEWIFPLRSKIIFRDKTLVFGSEYLKSLKKIDSKRNLFIIQLCSEIKKYIKHKLK